MSYKKNNLTTAPIPFYIHLAANIQSAKHCFCQKGPSFRDIEYSIADDLVEVPKQLGKKYRQQNQNIYSTLYTGVASQYTGGIGK